MDPVNVIVARAILPEILDRAEAGEEITIMRYGRPVAVVLSLPASGTGTQAGPALAPKRSAPPSSGPVAFLCPTQACLAIGPMHWLNDVGQPVPAPDGRLRR